MSAMFEFTGRFHPVLVHLPIGFLLLAVFFQWLSRKEKHKALAHAVRVSYLLGMVSAVLSCITGLLLSSNGEYDVGTLNLHKWFGISVAVVSAVGYWLAAKNNPGLKMVLGVVLFLLILITGHFGGTLTHGEGFLTKGFSQGTKDSAASPKKTIANMQEAVVFTDIIQPILMDKCGGCHGSAKQKGGLRLDAPEWILKGGKNGPVYIAGNAEASELNKRITLDPLDEKHMAPKGKPQLTEREINLIQWWIGANAGFDKKVKDIPSTPKIEAALKELQSAAPAARSSEIPAEPVEKVDDSVMDSLRRAGIVILPVSAGSNYLLANFISIPKLDERTVALLQQVSKQLVWLKINYTDLSDASWQIIGGCKNLRRLSVEHTNLSDAQLKYISALTHLVYLNLVATKVSFAGLQQLTSLKHLEHLYLGQTNVKGDEFSRLKNVFPGTHIDSGNYRLQFIAADTQLLHPPKK